MNLYLPIEGNSIIFIDAFSKSIKYRYAIEKFTKQFFKLQDTNSSTNSIALREQKKMLNPT